MDIPFDWQNIISGIGMAGALFFMLYWYERKRNEVIGDRVADIAREFGEVVKEFAVSQERTVNAVENNTQAMHSLTNKVEYILVNGNKKK